MGISGAGSTPVGAGGANPVTPSTCPGVFDGPVPNPSPDRSDSGLVGLRVLRERVERSREAFRLYETAHGRHYWYQRQYASFTGNYCKTTITVDNGVVTSHKQLQGVTGSTWTNVWTETGADLGSHEYPCARAATMEELYEECLSEVLCQDPRENSVFVQIDGRGLLVVCGYVPMNCFDDCYSGITPLILTADGKDWTETGPQCCPPSPEPDCCMSYGGATKERSCLTACDGMPSPNNPRWSVGFDAADCPVWNEPPRSADCCGCPVVLDAGAGSDGGP